MLCTQLYGPYGTLRYLAGSMGTTKGFTGQYGDSLSGLDYYHARYYDPVVGLFLSADKVQGNPQGLDSYSYVGDNPKTHTDPTGQRVMCEQDCGSGGNDPTPPPPPTGHKQGSGPVGPCGPSDDCNSPPPNCQQQGTCSGNGNNHHRNHPGPKIKLDGGCDAQCLAHDSQLIREHDILVSALMADLGSAFGYLVSALADWGLEEWVSLGFDLASLVLQGVAVVQDIVALSGSVPTWLSAVVHFGQIVVGTLNIVRGVFSLFGGLSSVLNSFSFVKGIFTVAREDIAGFLQSGLGRLFGGTSDYVAGYVGLHGDVLSTASPQEIHDQCLAEHLTGCQ